MEEIYTIEGDKAEIKLDSQLYNAVDLQNVEYQLSSKSILKFSLSSDKSTFLIILQANSNSNINELVSEFFYCLAEQQVRSNLQKENSKIRELIVEQAFSPIANLEDRTSEL